MQFSVRFATVEARRAAVLTAEGQPEGEPFYILESGGTTRAIVDAPTFDALYAPAQIVMTLITDAPPAAPAVPKNPAPAKSNQSAKKPAPAAKPENAAKKPESAAPSGRPSVPQMVLELIRKGPARSSLELVALLQSKDPSITHGAVYQATKYHKDKGLVIPRPDDTDGVMKWFPKGDARD